MPGIRRGRPPGQGRPRSKFIAEDLTRRLQCGEWTAGQTLPSCRQFAKAYRASLKTVHLAFQVLKTQGSVIVNPRQQPVASCGATLHSIVDGSIALITTSHNGLDINGTKSPRESILHGISKWRPGGFIGTLIVLQDGNRWRVEYPVGLQELPIKGILLLGPFPAHLLRRYEAMKQPVVLLDQPAEKFNVHSVAVANFDAAHDATLRLIKLGHRRMAFLRYPVYRIQDIDPDARERQTGFTAACRKSGLKDDACQVFTAGFHGSKGILENIIDSKPRITAVVAASPGYADQIAKGAKAAGLSIPRDLSIITFAEKGTAWSGPQIDFESIGREGLNLLLRRPRTIERIRIPASWNAGSTCSAPRR